MFEIIGKYTTALVTIDDVEQECVDQIYRMVNNPAFTNKIVIMPDTHAGKGSVIGFTIPLTDKIIPNVVGVDIGCGMLSFNIGDSITENKDKLLKIDEKIVLLYHLVITYNNIHMYHQNILKRIFHGQKQMTLQRILL